MKKVGISLVFIAAWRYEISLLRWKIFHLFAALTREIIQHSKGNFLSPPDVISSISMIRNILKLCLRLATKKRQGRGGLCGTLSSLACENSRFSLLLAAGNVSRGGTSLTQRRKFHTDDVNQCLHNISGSHGVPQPNLFNFTFLLVDFTKVWCSSANELQQNSNASSREEYVPPILTVLLEIHRVYIWPSWPFVFCLSFVNNFTSSVWNFCRWVAEIIPCETSSAAKSEEKRLFSEGYVKFKLIFLMSANLLVIMPPGTF